MKRTSNRELLDWGSFLEAAGFPHIFRPISEDESLWGQVGVNDFKGLRGCGLEGVLGLFAFWPLNGNFKRCPRPFHVNRGYGLAEVAASCSDFVRPVWTLFCMKGDSRANGLRVSWHALELQTQGLCSMSVGLLQEKQSIVVLKHR